MILYEPSKSGIRRRICEDMGQTVDSRLNALDGLLLRTNVRNGHLIATMCSNDDGLDLDSRQSGKVMLVDDLDVIGSFCNAGVHERLNMDVIRLRKCGYGRASHLCRMSTRSSDDGPCG